MDHRNALIAISALCFVSVGYAGKNLREVLAHNDPTALETTSRLEEIMDRLGV